MSEEVAPSPFLDLPPELRLRMYHYTIHAKLDIPINGLEARRFKTKLSGKIPWVNLMLSCKLVQHELRGMMRHQAQPYNRTFVISVNFDDISNWATQACGYEVSWSTIPCRPKEAVALSLNVILPLASKAKGDTRYSLRITPLAFIFMAFTTTIRLGRDSPWSLEPPVNCHQVNINICNAFFSDQSTPDQRVETTRSPSRAQVYRRMIIDDDSNQFSEADRIHITDMKTGEHIHLIRPDEVAYRRSGRTWPGWKANAWLETKRTTARFSRLRSSME